MIYLFYLNLFKILVTPGITLALQNTVCQSGVGLPAGLENPGYKA